MELQGKFYGYCVEYSVERFEGFFLVESMTRFTKTYTSKVLDIY